MKKKVVKTMLKTLSHPLMANTLRKVSKSNLSRKIIPQYQKTFNIDMSEVEQPINEFKSLHEFFIRRLKPETRPLANSDLISPVDGTIGDYGDITETSMIMVKGHSFSVAEILGDASLAQQFVHGKYMMIYLSPANYHRIHALSDAHLEKEYFLGQASYPVNELGYTYGEQILETNYRLIQLLKDKQTEHEYIKIDVGALNVNSIEVTYESPEWVKGQEVGYFSFGSTVVLLFKSQTIEWHFMTSDGTIKMGEKLANFI